MNPEAAGPNPHPGLRPFQADETELYFGRDEQRIELLHRLRLSRLLAIVGTSGSGKSSLVRAGLLPGLHGGFMAGRSARWRIVDMRPGTNAIANLARALDRPDVLRETSDDDGPSFTEAALRRSGLGLVEVVREARLPAGENVLVLVDQFEELFRAIDATDLSQTGDDASAFIKLLLEAARQPALPIYIVLTMRSDFLGECARLRDLPEALNDGQYLVPRLASVQEVADVAETSTAEVIEVVEAFRAPGNSFLMPPAGEPLAPHDYLDISHESLIRNWSKFVGAKDTQVTPPRVQIGWVEQKAESARVYERLSSTALLHSKQQAALWVQPDLGVALQWHATEQLNRSWSLRYNTAFEPAMAFLAASQATAQAIEDRISRRRRQWVLAAGLVFALMLTGSLNWLKDELSQAAKLRRQAKETAASLGHHRALVQLYQSRLAGGSFTVPPRACGPADAPSAAPDALSKRLCDPSHTLGEADRAEILALEQVIDGRWVEASASLNAPAVQGTDLALARELLNRLATTPSPADRYERGLLGRLTNLPAPTQPDPPPGTQQTRNEAGGLSHPVHKRIGQLLAGGARDTLNEEEQVLVAAYERAERARSDPGAIGLRISFRRNRVLALNVLMAVLAYVAALLMSTFYALLVVPLCLLLFPLFNYGWSLWHNGRTWIDQRSGTRVVDADSAESLAARP